MDSNWSYRDSNWIVLYCDFTNILFDKDMAK